MRAQINVVLDCDEGEYACKATATAKAKKKELSASKVEGPPWNNDEEEATAEKKPSFWKTPPSDW